MDDLNENNPLNIATFNGLGLVKSCIKLLIVTFTSTDFLTLSVISVWLVTN